MAAVDDPDTRALAAEAYHNDPRPDEALFEFDIVRCMIARYKHRGDWPPTYLTWVDPAYRRPL